MKVADFFWENPVLIKFLREIPEGEYLFREGDSASTMFVVVRGAVELKAGRRGNGRLISVIGAGEFLGEKAIIQSNAYPRAFSAQAKSRLLVLELGIDDVQRIKEADAEIMTDLLKEMFLTAAHRLDRSNGLVSVLRSSNNIERLVHLMIYFGKTYGRLGPRGLEVFLQKDTICYYIDMPIGEIDNALNELVVKGLMIRDSEDNYTIADEQKLLSSAPELTERIKNGFFDELESIP